MMICELSPLCMGMLTYAKVDHGTTMLGLSLNNLYQMGTAIIDILSPMGVEVVTWCTYQANL